MQTGLTSTAAAPAGAKPGARARPGVARASPRDAPASGKGKLPERGFFAVPDPKAQVYPVKSGVGNGDVTKRGGRWESDFIWNKDWAKQLDYQERQRQKREEAERKAKEGPKPGAFGPPADSPIIRGGAPDKGFLSLTSKVDLNSMDVDLSEQLRVRKRSAGEASSSSAPRAPREPRRRPPPKYGSVPPTQGEKRSWQRSGKFSRKVVATAPTNDADADALEAKRKAEVERYEQLKAELQAWAAGLTVVCFAATFAFYGRDVAASYGVGALGGLLYLRLLNRSVDGVGGGLGGALGGQRLLIPVILALGYNRYNTLVAEETGLTLQLLPILLGFFTYKGAVVAKQSLTLFGELAAGARGGAGAGSEGGEGGEGSGGEGGEGGAGGMDVQSVDRAFRRRMLSEM